MDMKCPPGWTSRRCSEIIICTKPPALFLSHPTRHLVNSISLPFPSPPVILANSGKAKTFLTRLTDRVAFTCKITGDASGN